MSAVLAQDIQDICMCDIVASTNVANIFSVWSCDVSGVPTSNVCNWEGVSCSTTDGVVVVLSLFADHITGSLPDSIGSLSSLNNLILSSNSFSGSLPDSIGSLSSLISLALDVNRFTGSLPDSIGSLSSLYYLQLGVNSFSGSLPDSIGSLSSLTYLYLHSNSFTGSLPDSIGSLSSLPSLNLGSNSFAGTLPDSIGSLSNLTSLDLVGNSFTGSLPDSIGSLSSLYNLDIGSNSFTGSLPDSIGSLSSLTYLYLDSNSFAGSLPDSIGSLSSLIYINLGFNSFTGSLPDSIGSLSSLYNFYVGSNSFAGSLPDSIGSLSSLYNLQLDSNSFTGSLPDSIGSLSSLTSLDLGSNSFTGTLPSVWGLMSSLTSLDATGTSLSGTVSTTFCTHPSMYLSLPTTVVCHPACLTNVVGGGRSNCEVCPPGTTINVSSFVCSGCPVDTYQPFYANATECTACVSPWTTATKSSQASCLYFRLVWDLGTIYIVLVSIVAMYVLAFAAAGEKSLAIVLNMFLPMLDHVTDTLYVMHEPFYSLGVFQAAAFFLVAPCIIFGYDLVEAGDFPVVCKPPFPTLWPEFRDGKPTYNGEVVGAHLRPLLVVLQLIWTLWYTALLVVWFVVGSFLYNSRTLAVGRVRRLWYYVWRGFKHGTDIDEKVAVDTTVLNKALFTGFVLENMPQLIIQIYNSVMVGWGILAQLSIAASVLMTLAGVYKFIYWRWARGVEWADIPVTPLIPNVSWLKLAEVDAASAADDREAKRNLAELDQPDSCEAGEDEFAVYAYKPATSLWETIFWLRSVGGVPTYRGMDVFPSFDQHDSLAQFLFIVNVWMSCLILQAMTILLVPLWFPLMWLGFDVVHMPSYSRRHKGYLKQCILNLCSLLVVVILFSKDFYIYSQGSCDPHIESGVYHKAVCNDPDYALYVFAEVVLVGLFMLWIAYRLLREHWSRRFLSVILAALLWTITDTLMYYSIYSDFSLVMIVLMTVLDVMKFSARSLRSKGKEEENNSRLFC